mmetsp:Transcript_34103/g.85030  ORF Transcript_34103/g.85030 Transcript_34103/m.85030 type:complete len:81 (-) Transcript_34103:1784-2026(-)
MAIDSTEYFINPEAQYSFLFLDSFDFIQTSKQLAQKNVEPQTGALSQASSSHFSRQSVHHDLWLSRATADSMDELLGLSN